MKAFLVGLYALFAFAMASGITIAYRQSEGLVDTDYYEKARTYFSAKAAESSNGLRLTLPDSLHRGKNHVQVRLFSHGKPLENATVKLFLGNLSKTKYDRTIPLQETAPGIYGTGQAEIPFGGIWLVRVDIAKEHLKTTRTWFAEIN